ncbi:MAG: aldehyde ferredoxin oxidoreductase family protein [candidate division NC10 bacterium]|nr:aldehyde ferredoxin oxidoreductase family protein [candidate division NC10 bacterium]
MGGWTGQFLRVNLSKGVCSKEKLDPTIARDFIGGRGLASKILYNETDPKVDPLSPQNKILFATGPLTGTGATAGSRYMTVTKSPLTGAIASSNMGGYFPAEMKFAGYDLIIVEGKSEKPVYLWINNDQVEIRCAEHIWGKTVWEVEDLLKAETDEEAKFASIGPAGEKLVRFACVINDKHRGGRSGVGAVMGSKNLKAIAVRGTKGLKVARKDAFLEVVMAAMAKLKAAPVTGQGLPTYGTPIVVNIINAHGFFPTRNFQEGVFATANKISGETMRETTLIRNKACFGCPIACSRVTEVKEGPFKGVGEGPEYEALWSLGADCGIDNLEAVTKANYLCNELGMDPISVGATLACAMEMYEKGIISESDVGRSLNFGDPEALVEMTEKAGRREGFGNVLAEGALRVAQKYGHPEFFMGVKGQEFPAYDGRGAQGMALNYATSNRGACHVRGYTIAPEVFGIPLKMDPFTTEGKAAIDKAFQDITAIVDSSGLCLFLTFGIGMEEILPMLEAATGAGYNMENLLKAGERIWNLERLFNIREGFTAADDTLPKRILEEPIPAGPAQGKVARLSEMLPEYYRLRGWDEQGVPTNEKLRELGLA